MSYGFHWQIANTVTAQARDAIYISIARSGGRYRAYAAGQTRKFYDSFCIIIIMYIYMMYIYVQTK